MWPIAVRSRERLDLVTLVFLPYYKIGTSGRDSSALRLPNRDLWNLILRAADFWQRASETAKSSPENEAVPALPWYTA
jgi:hypothetical protein